MKTCYYLEELHKEILLEEEDIQAVPESAVPTKPATRLRLKTILSASSRLTPLNRSGRPCVEFATAPGYAAAMKR